MCPIFLVALLVSVPLQCAADNEQNVFIYPTAPGPQQNYVANELWHLGDIRKVQWTTNYTSYYIELFPQVLDTTTVNYVADVYDTNGLDGSGDQSFEWTVQLYSSNLTLSPVYYFWLHTGDSYVFSAHYFNISSASSSSSTTSATSKASTLSSTTLSSTTVSTIATTTGATNINTPTVTSLASAPLPSNNGYKIGLGVGLGLGLPLAFALGIGVVLRSLKKRHSREGTGSTQSEHPLADGFSNTLPPAYPDKSQHELYSDRPPQWHELASGTDWPHEAPSGELQTPVELPEER